MAFSMDDKTLALMYWDDIDPKVDNIKTIVVDVPSKTVVNSIDAAYEGVSILVSNDRSKIVSASETDGGATVWDTSRPGLVRTLAYYPSDRNHGTEIGLTPDERLVLTHSVGGQSRIDIIPLSSLKTLPLTQQPVKTSEASPIFPKGPGSIVALGSSTGSATSCALSDTTFVRVGAFAILIRLQRALTDSAMPNSFCSDPCKLVYWTTMACGAWEWELMYHLRFTLN